ncbi:MAG: hydrogenase accessory protein HypB [Methylococcaceae bacterium]|nr:MAG: hydrogenase accessory protein HypB [Methylococcaceae bacterium]
MCSVCGCGESHQHDHLHGKAHGHGHHQHYGLGPAGLHVTGMSQERIIRLEQDILGRNDGHAAQNRRYLQNHGILALNLVSSPGSGKTTLLERSLRHLQGRRPLAVIEGDQQTQNDAERIRATGVQAIQINTGKGCHLDAHMIAHALETLALEDNGLLFIENVGNLVCPAMFDLGETAKVVILSVTEGEDKPLKYPDMFHRAGLVLVNKIDLLPHLQFDLERCLGYVRQINAQAPVICLSATSGEGMDQWYGWLEQQAAAVPGAVQD